MSHIFYAVSDSDFNIVSMNNGPASLTTKAVFSTKVEAEAALAKSHKELNLKVIACHIIEVSEELLK